MFPVWYVFVGRTRGWYWRCCCGCFFHKSGWRRPTRTTTTATQQRRDTVCAHFPHEIEIHTTHKPPATLAKCRHFRRVQNRNYLCLLGCAGFGVQHLYVNRTLHIIHMENLSLRECAGGSVIPGWSKWVRWYARYQSYCVWIGAHFESLLSCLHEFYVAPSMRFCEKKWQSTIP